MARPYSLDLRERVVAAVAAGLSCREVARTFKVSVASVVKWSQRFRSTGSAAAKPMGGRQKHSLAPQRAWILARLEAAPDVTLRALVVELGERGVVTSYGSGARRRAELQKKHCSQPSNFVLMWRGAGRGGRRTNTGLMRRGWSSSTRPGPKPT
jgi:transposase